MYKLKYLDPCYYWPEIYFEKNDFPNETLIEEMYKYGEKNLAKIKVMIQSPYVTKIRRDVAMTFTSFVANAGGLLGSVMTVLKIRVLQT